jgi:O-antigen/teichoic acid export membrane protein
VFVSRGLEIALQRVDRLLVGTFMGDTRLGFYHQGRFLAETGLVVGRPLERVTLNLYARIQNAPGHLEQAFGLTQFFLVRLMFAGAAVLLVVPEATVQLLLGAAWLPAAPILVAMTLHAALAPPLANTKQLLYGRGEVGKSVAVRLVELGCFLPLLAAGIVFDDIRMAAFGLSIATCVGLVLALWFSRDVAGPVLRRDFAMPVIALAAALVLWLAPVRERLDALPDLFVPLVPVLIYAGVLFTLDGAAIARNLRTLRASFAQRG